jgi:hypothetical protein
MAAGESIYNLIPQPVPMVIKPEMHRSKHAGIKPPTFSSFGLTGTSKPGFNNVAGEAAAATGGHHNYTKPHATMGREGNARKPADILKKGTGGGGGAAEYAAAPPPGTRPPTHATPAAVRPWRARASSCHRPRGRHARAALTARRDPWQSRPTPRRFHCHAPRPCAACVSADAALDRAPSRGPMRRTLPTVAAPA